MKNCVAWCKAQVWWETAKQGIDQGYLVEIHVAEGVIPEEMIRADRLAVGVRVLAVTSRLTDGMLVVMECPIVKVGRFHARTDEIADRAEEIAEMILPKGAEEVASDEEWN